jgi:adenosyl cobinamide kinase/adenosyl cobinamide phosphate guanylyltransferase
MVLTTWLSSNLSMQPAPTLSQCFLALLRSSDSHFVLLIDCLGMWLSLTLSDFVVHKCSRDCNFQFEGEYMRLFSRVDRQFCIVSMGDC